MTYPQGVRPRSRWLDITAVGVLSALMASGGTYAVMNFDDPGVGPVVVEADGSTNTATPASYTSSSDWDGVAANVSPSVVSIDVASEQGAGAGSGVIWNDEGHVVTNAHVIAGATEVAITLADGRTYAAAVTGEDESTDLAVLQITDPPADLRPIETNDGTDIAVGAPVMAIGNPLGLSGTVTTGIVSALDRPVSTQSASANSATVTNAIQTSAAINPGNSGGALVNNDGELIGINSAIASLSDGSSQSGSIGIGFAIPMRSVDSIVDQLIETGTAEHAFLGVGLNNASSQVDGATLAGAGVTSVEPGTPAESVGLQTGDVIVRIDGERVGSAESLVAQVRERSTGDEIELGVIRDGEEDAYTVTLDARPDEG